MVILELVKEIGLDPIKAAATKGGEFKSACPECGGRDRFCIWPNVEKGGRYWCRSCGKRGDAIQFCRDFLGLSYSDSLRKLNLEIPSGNLSAQRRLKTHLLNLRLAESVLPCELWQARAQQFLRKAHQQLLASRAAVQLLEERGINHHSILQFQLGWNPDTLFEPASAWGLSDEQTSSGILRKQWLPTGLVVPTFQSGNVVQLKIRRTEWHTDDRLPKYVAISGSKKGLTIIGDVQSACVVVESEFDGILILQEAGDLCSVLPLGGVAKTPDRETHDQLSRTAVLLLALDFDEIGKKHTKLWMKRYPKAKAWPAPKAKSPGDAFQNHGVSLREWISMALNKKVLK